MSQRVFSRLAFVGERNRSLLLLEEAGLRVQQEFWSAQRYGTQRKPTEQKHDQWPQVPVALALVQPTIAGLDPLNL